MGNTIKGRFMLQQGFAPEEQERQFSHFRALTLQPAAIAVLVVIGIVLQAREVFLALAVVLAWNVTFPQWNAFERLYDWAIGRGRGEPKLEPAPAPRRFSQGMAATFMLLAGLSLSLGWQTAAYVFEGFVVVALTALLAGKFCLGSYIYHLLRGRLDFANSTAPWSKG
jgi:hypothetical protein